MIVVSRIIHVKVDRRLNVTNKFKYQRRLSSRLPIVMFRGTPCIKVQKGERETSTGANGGGGGKATSTGKIINTSEKAHKNIILCFVFDPSLF